VVHLIFFVKVGPWTKKVENNWCGPKMNLDR